MKKLLKVFVIGFAAVVLVLVGAVYFFPTGWLKDRAVREMETALKQPVKIEKIRFSLFPVGLAVQGLKIGDVPAPGKPTLSLDSFRIGVHLLPLLQRKLRVSEVTILKPEIVMVKTEEKGAAEPAPAEKAPAGAPFLVTLQKLTIRDAAFTLREANGSPFVEVAEFDETLTASVSSSGDASVDGETKIGKIALHLPGGQFGQGMTVEFKKKLSYEAARDFLKIEKAELKLADLPIAVEGSVLGVKSDAREIDLKLSGGPVNVKSILAYLPAKLVPEMKGVRSEGNLAFSASAKGKVDAAKKVPIRDLVYEVALSLKNGKVIHPQLPAPIEDIRIDVRATPVRLDVKEFHLKTGGSVVAVHAAVTNYRTDPSIDGGVRIDADLAQLAALQPPTSKVKAAGKLNLTAKMAGKPTPLTALRLDGDVGLSNVSAETPDLPVPLRKVNGHMGLKGSGLYVRQLSAELGKSDFTLDGTVNGVVPMLLGDTKETPIDAEVALKCRKLDLDEIAKMGGEQKKDEAPLTLPPFFSRLKAKADLRAGQLVVNGLDARNVKALLKIDRRVLTISQMGLDVFSGSIGLTGAVDLKDEKTPKFDFDLDLKNIAAEKLLAYAKNVDKITQLGSYFSARINGKAKLKGDLKNGGELNLASLFSSGSLGLSQAKLSNHPVQNVVSAMMARPEIKTLSIPKWTQPFRIEGGKLNFNDLKINAGPLQMKGKGWQSVDGGVGMDLDMRVPDSWASGLKNQLPGPLASVLVGKNEPLDLPFLVSGKITSPSVALDTKAMTAVLEKRLQAKMKSEVQSQLKGIMGDGKKKPGQKPNTQKSVQDQLKKLF